MSQATVSDDSSEASTLTILRDDVSKQVLEDFDNPALTTDDLVRKAHSYIRSLSTTDVIEGVAELKAAPILRAIIKHAPCSQGQRYAACAIIGCGNEKRQLIDIANDWVKFFLLPCRCPVFLSQTHHSS